QKRVAVDRWCHCSDLWTTISYHRCSTVWSYLLGHRFMAPRKTLPDPDPGQSAPQPVSAEQDRFEMNYIREVSRRTDAEQMADALRLYCPPALRDRTLFLVLRESPALVRRLTDEERDGYEAFQIHLACALRRVGFQAV